MTALYFDEIMGKQMGGYTPLNCEGVWIWVLFECFMYNKYLKLRNLFFNMFATQEEFKEEEFKGKEFHIVLDS